MEKEELLYKMNQLEQVLMEVKVDLYKLQEEYWRLYGKEEYKKLDKKRKRLAKKESKNIIPIEEKKD
jgi:predicted nuclease with TOPRIM domain